MALVIKEDHRKASVPSQVVVSKSQKDIHLQIQMVPTTKFRKSPKKKFLDKAMVAKVEATSLCRVFSRI